MPSIRTCSRWATISALVCRRCCCWFWPLFGPLMFKGTDTLVPAQTQNGSMTIIEIRPFRNGWKCFEAAGVCCTVGGIRYSPLNEIEEQALTFDQAGIQDIPHEQLDSVR